MPTEDRMPGAAHETRKCVVVLLADVLQEYEVQVINAYVLKGNVAVLKCGISAFVRDVVSVSSWLREEPQAGRTTLHPGSRLVPTHSSLKS
ncbi:hypothetical protein PR048_023343 [Dryococelus australis]|uniref:Uncharacterized protein n=1 Tax=Dryococelus australis TaxID=614101 RepID=A0ABQ9GTX4_9NEOP|nr:hypothetical protein PR048_023343 [Dryococelus australis]